MWPGRRGEGVPPLRCEAILALPNHAATHPSRAKAVECRPAAEETEKEGTNRQPTTAYRPLPFGFVALCENHANGGDGLFDRGSWDKWAIQEQS
jgi:hypothetical protein